MYMNLTILILAYIFWMHFGHVPSNKANDVKYTSFFLLSHVKPHCKNYIVNRIEK